jgi:crotonobetainyl-CoA:carnitine CoA-transferase CaiB-like acyl-CoA transferase
VSKNKGPLSGIKVIDLAAYIAGPYAATLLADQGAEVLKIEPPEGDNLRHYPSTLAQESRAFLGINRSKTGRVLNLKNPAEQQQLYALLNDCDVLIHNFRAGVAERLGIGYESLAARFPRLLYCVLSGYGSQGPLAGRAGYDQVLQSFSGLAHEQNQAAPQLLYGSVVDTMAGTLLAGAISSALYERERSGQGQKVEVSLLSAALSMQSARLIKTPNEPRDIARDMRSGGITGIHPCLEGHLYLSANTAHFWQALCELCGLTEWLVERYDTVRKRATHADELLPKLRQVLAQKSALAWEALLSERVPCSAVRPLADVFEHPQCTPHLHTFTHPKAGVYVGFAHAASFSRSGAPLPFSAPLLRS